MKFGNFSNVGGAFVDNERNSFNIGDYIQIIAINELYCRMGIESDQIVYIRMSDLESYKGEKIILPINFMITDMMFCRDGRFLISDDIIPVFIGICIYRDGFTFSEYNIEYFKKYSPVGCRDYITFQLLKSYGIPCYLSGCITLTLPFRDEFICTCNKVYFVDVPEFVRNYVPDDIMQDIEFKHHILEISKTDFKDEDYAMRVSEELLNEYKFRAKLVVTSRLHCAAPCIGMGIPTIIVREYSGYTFEWIKQYSKVYFESDMKEMDWNPEIPDISQVKEKMFRVARRQILRAWEEHHFFEIEDVYTLYKDTILDYKGTQKVGNNKLHERLNYSFSKNVKSYCIWGISEDAEEIYNYLSNNFSDAKLVKVVDTYRELTFHNVRSEKPEIFNKHDDFLTIVTSVNAVNAAKDLFDRIGKNRNEYVLIADTFMDKK